MVPWNEKSLVFLPDFHSHELFQVMIIEYFSNNLVIAAYVALFNGQAQELSFKE